MKYVCINEQMQLHLLLKFTHTKICNEAMDISLEVTQSHLENVITALFGVGKCSIMSCFERSRVHLNTLPLTTLTTHPPTQFPTHLKSHSITPCISLSFLHLSVFISVSLNAALWLVLAGISVSIKQSTWCCYFSLPAGSVLTELYFFKV